MQDTKTRQKISCISLINNEQYRKEAKKTISFMIASKRINYLGINEGGEKPVH